MAISVPASLTAIADTQPMTRRAVIVGFWRSVSDESVLKAKRTNNIFSYSCKVNTVDKAVARADEDGLLHFGGRGRVPEDVENGGFGPGIESGNFPPAFGQITYLEKS
jgi:hypothetical protein